MEKWKEAIERYKASYEAVREESSFLLNADSSLEKLDSIGFPTKKTEDWKYTNVAPILKESFSLSGVTESLTKNEVNSKFLEDFDCYKLVLVDGVYSTEFSDTIDEEGIVIGSLKENYRKDETFVSQYLGKLNKIETGFDLLNQAFSLDGFYAYIKKNKILSKPVQVLFLNTTENRLTTPRNLIIAEESSAAKIIFNYVSLTEGKYFTHTVNEFYAAENSNIEVYKIQNESKNAFHLDKVNISQREDSTFSHYSFSFGASLARNDIEASLNGENITSNLYGLYIGSGKQHVDHRTFIDHAKPNCQSNELYKGIMDDESTGVFSGKILVRQDAQKTNAYQSNKNVILSDKASVDTKPQLEIYADDVKCSHGATVGRLNDEAYFYIRSRGVPSNIAKSMLIRAFASDVVDKVKIEGIKGTLNQLIFDNLHRVKI